jgi:hypothetical protein
VRCALFAIVSDICIPAKIFQKYRPIWFFVIDENGTIFASDIVARSAKE